MSPENAIQWLKIIKATLNANDEKHKISAIDIAIKSIEQQKN